MIRRVAIAAGLATIAALAPVFSMPAGAADTAVNLPLGTFTDMVVDQAHGLVFASGRVNNFINDGYSGGVAVFSTSGANMRKIAGTTDAAAMTLGPDGLLYVAEDSGQIAVIDPATSTVTTTYSTKDAGCPDDLAFAGSQLWLSYSCGPAVAAGGAPTTGVAAVNTADDTVTMSLTRDTNYQLIRLASVPGKPGELIAANVGAQGGDLDILSIAGAAATVAAELDQVNSGDLAVSPDGSTVLAANNAGSTYSTADLSLGPISYRAPQGAPNGVAYSADGGYLAVGAGQVGSPDTVTTFATGSSTVIRNYDTSTPGFAGPHQTTIPAARGVAWVGRSLLAVYADYGDAYPVVKILGSALQTPVSVSLSGPASATRGGRLTLTGQLSSVAPVAGLNLVVTKRDQAGLHTLPTVTTSASGSFSITDVPQIGSTNTYSVAYAGDASHAPASKSFSVAVSRLTPSMGIYLDHPVYNYHSYSRITVHLGSHNNGRTVTIYATPAGKPRQLLRTLTINAGGNAAWTFPMNYDTRFFGVFNGDYQYAPRTVTIVGNTIMKVTATLHGAYGSSGGYALYPSYEYAGIVGSVLPAKAGSCATFESQYYSAGRWLNGSSLACSVLSGASATGVGFHGRTGLPYRLRVTHRTDALNLGAASPWVYLRFT